jgi:hypothetical protein
MSPMIQLMLVQDNSHSGTASPLHEEFLYLQTIYDLSATSPTRSKRPKLTLDVEVACYPLPAPYSVTNMSMYTRDRRQFPQLTRSNSNGRYSYNRSINDNRSTSRSSMVVGKDPGQVSVNAAKRTTPPSFLACHSSQKRVVFPAL